MSTAFSSVSSSTMGKVAVAAVWATAGCTVAVDRTNKAFQSGPTTSRSSALSHTAATSEYKVPVHRDMQAPNSSVSMCAAVAGFSVGSAALAYSARAAASTGRPAGQVRARVARKQAQQGDIRTATPTFDASKQVGVTEPLDFFDPLGITDHVNEKGFRHLRAAELKHGRVAMLAAFGCVVQHYISFPGFEDVPSGIGALETDMGRSGLAALILASGIFETVLWTEDESRLPGDYGNPGSILADIEVDDDLRNKEINNGRFAMIAIMAILVTEFVTGKDGVEQISELDMTAVFSSAEAMAAATFSSAADVLQSLLGMDGAQSIADGQDMMSAAADVASVAKTAAGS